MNKNPKKPETFIPHQQKAVAILTGIQKIQSKYISLVKPKMEKEISNLLETIRSDPKTLSFFGDLLKDSDKYEKIKDTLLLEPMLEKMFKKFISPQNNESTLFLSENADLYRKPKKDHCYRMKSGGTRHQIILLLMNLKENKFFPSRLLENKSGCGSYRALTDAVSEINNNAQTSLKLSKKYRLIVSKSPHGYKINDFYTIFPE